VKPPSQRNENNEDYVKGWIDSEITIKRSLQKRRLQMVDEPYVSTDENLDFDIQSTIYRGVTDRAGGPDESPFEILETPGSVPSRSNISAKLEEFKRYYESLLKFGDSFAIISAVSEPSALPMPTISDRIPTYRTEVSACINQFMRDQNGYTSEASGNFFRMLYFAATTVTTLGLGDIVPVSALARAIVTLETVSGIFAAGMFLNALANRAKDRSRP
jgi:hypothetical protein